MSPGIPSRRHEILYADFLVHYRRIFLSLLAGVIALPKVSLFGFPL